jgi:hypothetical protein
MNSFALKMIVALAVFLSCGNKSTTPAPQPVDVLTIINNIKANTNKIHTFSADFTLQQVNLDSTGTTPVDTTPRNARLYFASGTTIDPFVGDTLDTLVFSLKENDTDTTWISHSNVWGTGGATFPKYESFFIKPVLADTFYGEWYYTPIPSFKATIDTSVNNDSIIVLHHMNSSVFFDYTVDKKRWLLKRIVASAYDVYDATYFWGRTNSGIYYPSAVEITSEGLVAGVYPFTNIKVNGTAVP